MFYRETVNSAGRADLKMTNWTWVGLWALWTVMSAYLLSRHEMWFDEIQSWKIVDESRSISELAHNLKWEGHPPLWYLVLWPATWISDSIHMVQVVNLVICSSMVYLVLRCMPVPLVVRAALVFGYVPFYEVGAISRSYGLMFLLGVATVILANRTEGPNVPAVVAVAGMAATSVVAVPLAVGFVIARWGLPWWRERAKSHVHVGWVAAGLALIAAGVVMSLPAAGGGPKADFRLPTTTAVNRAFSMLTNVFLPVPKFQISFWNTSIIQKTDSRLPWVIGLVLFLCVLVALRRSITAVILWVIGVGGYMSAVVISKMPFRVRHASVIWLALLMIVWMIAADRNLTIEAKRRFAPAWVQSVAILVALSSVFTAYFAARQDMRYRFSGATDAANWIKQNAVGPYSILCAVDQSVCASVAVRLRADAYPNAEAEPIRFVEFKKGWSRSTTPPMLAVSEARLLQERTGTQVFIVADAWVMPPDCTVGIRTIPVIVEPIGVCTP